MKLPYKKRPIYPPWSSVIPQKSPTYMHTSRVLLLPLPIILPTQEQFNIQKSPINPQKSPTYVHVSRVMLLPRHMISHLTSPPCKKTINPPKITVNLQKKKKSPTYMWICKRALRICKSAKEPYIYVNLQKSPTCMYICKKALRKCKSTKEPYIYVNLQKSRTYM